MPRTKKSVNKTVVKKGSLVDNNTELKNQLFSKMNE